MGKKNVENEGVDDSDEDGYGDEEDARTCYLIWKFPQIFLLIFGGRVKNEFLGHVKNFELRKWSRDTKCVPRLIWRKNPFKGHFIFHSKHFPSFLPSYLPLWSKQVSEYLRLFEFMFKCLAKVLFPLFERAHFQRNVKWIQI